MKTIKEITNEIVNEMKDTPSSNVHDLLWSFSNKFRNILDEEMPDLRTYRNIDASQSLIGFSFYIDNTLEYAFSVKVSKKRGKRQSSYWYGGSYEWSIASAEITNKEIENYPLSGVLAKMRDDKSRAESAKLEQLKESEKAAAELCGKSVKEFTDELSQMIKMLNQFDYSLTCEIKNAVRKECGRYCF